MSGAETLTNAATFAGEQKKGFLGRTMDKLQDGQMRTARGLIRRYTESLVGKEQERFTKDARELREVFNKKEAKIK